MPQKRGQSRQFMSFGYAKKLISALRPHFQGVATEGWGEFGRWLTTTADGPPCLEPPRIRLLHLAVALWVILLSLAGCSTQVPVPATAIAPSSTLPSESATAATATPQARADTDPTLTRPVQSGTAVEQWRADLRFLAERIPSIHPNPWHTVSEKAFAGAVDELNAAIPQLTDEQIVLELVRLVALLGEGHSFLSPIQTAAGFQLYPLRLYEFSDGIFVVDAAESYQEAIGAQVLGVGGMDMPRLYERLAPYIARDSDVGLKTMIPVRLINATMLQALGIVDDITRPAFRLRERTGEEFTLDLSPVSAEAYAAWNFPDDLGSLDTFRAFSEYTLMGGLPQRPAPLYLQARYSENFWYRYLQPSQTLYIQYNLVTSSSPGAGTLRAFSDEVASVVATRPVARIVVDMRHNPGGDNFTYPPFLDLLTQNQAINLPNRLYIITGRHTGSAAVNFLTDLEQRESKAILVGEPTISRPNLYGDPRLLLLPNSRLEVYISSRYWEKSDRDDARDQISPDIPLDLFSADFFAGRDPLLEWILAQRAITSQVSEGNRRLLTSG